MKILFLVDNLGAGGAERSLQELLPVFAGLGVEPVVACFQRREQGVESLVAGGHDLRFLGGGGRWQQLRRIRRLLQTEKFDLMHTTLFEADVFGRPAALGTAVPVVTSLVNMPYERARLEHDRNVNRAKLFAARLLESATGRFCADHFHAISSAVKSAAVDKLLLPEARITVVHRGRDPLRLGRRSRERRQKIRQGLGIADDRRVILNAGRQEYQKGQAVLIEALMRSADQSSLLLIAGRPGNASADLRKLAAPLGSRVMFLDHRDDVPDLMAAADVFALPSRWEGLGCVLLEAMALELPIVASDLPPIREVTEAGAVVQLVPAGDPAALSAALEAVLRDPGAQEARVARARRLFEGRFTIQRSGEAMFELFSDVRARHRSHQSHTR